MSRSTWSSTRGSMADSSSRNFSFFGFSAMSLGVARAFFGSFRVIRPAFCNSSRARPLLLPSLGMATVAPSFSSLRLLTFFE
ncbi:hypothetical protein D3C84_1166180 [compost metagenome]